MNCVWNSINQIWTKLQQRKWVTIRYLKSHRACFPNTLVTGNCVSVWSNMQPLFANKRSTFKWYPERDEFDKKAANAKANTRWTDPKEAFKVDSFFVLLIFFSPIKIARFILKCSAFLWICSCTGRGQKVKFTWWCRNSTVLESDRNKTCPASFSRLKVKSSARRFNLSPFVPDQCVGCQPSSWLV